MHEDFSRTEEVKGSSDRSFGLVMAAFFLILTFSRLLHAEHREIRWWALGVSAAFLILALFWQRPLQPLNWLWTKFGLVLYSVISPVALGLLFYLSVAPIGLLMRALGKDPLKLRRDPQAASYWVVRTPPGPPPESMKNQF